MTTVVFALTKNDVITWTLVAVLVIFIIAAAIAIMTVGTSYISPRLERLQKGLKPQPGEKPCCPPGAGCNDPDPALRACRRGKAIQFATATNNIVDAGLMEEHWTTYHSLPRWRKSARSKALSKYASVRDKIFFGMVAQNMEGDVSAVPQLKAAMSPSVEEVDDENVEVMDGDHAPHESRGRRGRR